MGDFPNNRSKLTTQNVLNIFAPTDIRSCVVSYAFSEDTVKPSSFADQGWRFNTFSFFSPVPVYWTVAQDGDPVPDLLPGIDSVHYWEGGRLSMSVGFRVKYIYFRPVDPAAEDFEIHLITG